MYTLLAVVSVAIIIGLNSYPVIAGFLKVVPGIHFLGTVHHPQDFYYYLSQFAQGKDGRWFTGTDLFTGEMQTYTWVGWSNILSGRIFGLLGISPIIAYQLAVLFGAIAVFFAAYHLALAILHDDPNKKFKSQIIVVLYAISNCYPILKLQDGKQIITFVEYWFNFGTPFTRLSAIPHHLVAQAAFLVTLTLAIKIATRTYKWKFTPYVIGVFMAILASINPVHALIAMGMIGLIFLPTCMLHFRKYRSVPLHILISTLLSTIGFFIPALYLKTLFLDMPYSQLTSWESMQQLYVPIWTYILNAGPILLLAILGLPFFIKRHPTHMPLVLFGATISPLFLFWLTPLAVSLHLGNVRFTSPITTFFWSCLAIESIWSLGFRLFPKKVKQVSWAILLIIIVYLAPSTYAQMQIRTGFDTNNAYLYLSDDIMSAYTYAQTVSQPKDIWYIQWPYNTTFPGITGRRSFHGHPLLTENAPAKEETAWGFIAPTTAMSERKRFANENHIAFVMVYQTVFNPVPSFLEKIWSNNTLVIYRVK